MSEEKSLSSIAYQNIDLPLKHIDLICPIYIRYRQSTGLAVSAKETQVYLQTEFSKGDDYIIIAKNADIPVGFLHYETERSTVRTGERLHIKALFVDEKYRRHGLATKLIQTVKILAKDREVIVKARRTNEISPHLYEKSGFSEDKNYIHFVFKGI